MRDWFVYEGLGTYGGASPNLMVVSGFYRYILTYEDQKLDRVNFRELYRIDSYPEELKNLARESKYAIKIKGFEKAIAQHLKEVVETSER